MVGADRGNEVKVGGSLSRRDFLKLVGGAAGAVATAGVLQACAPLSELGGPAPTLEPIEEGDAILLMVDGIKKQTVIQYAANQNVSVSHLAMRLVSGKVAPEKFEGGVTRERALGEILDGAALPLTLNTELLEEGTQVHYVVTTEPVIGINPPYRYSLEPSGYNGLYGIRVITSYADGINDKSNPPPVETNSRPLHAVSPKVGEGWALGHFQADGALKIMGFVQDARIFKPAPGK